MHYNILGQKLKLQPDIVSNNSNAESNSAWCSMCWCAHLLSNPLVFCGTKEPIDSGSWLLEP